MTSVKRTGKPIALLLLVLAVICFGCGGGGSGGTGLTAGGGIGGTGISAGVITAIGSVTVNGATYGTDSAIFTVDDDSSAGLADLAVGMRAIVEYTTRNNEAFSVFYEPELTGPVAAVPPDTAPDTILVLGQTVFVGDAIFDEDSGLTGIGDIEVGQILEISGFFNTNGEIQAVYVELEDPSLAEFKIKGAVQNHIFPTFEINGLTIDYSGLVPQPSIENGDFVEVEGGFSGALFVATELEIEDSPFSVQDDEEVEIEGLVTALAPVPEVDFEVSGFPVRLTAGTTYENGTEDDIVLNARLEVEGSVQGGVLISEKVEFK